MSPELANRILTRRALLIEHSKNSMAKASIRLDSSDFRQVLANHAEFARQTVPQLVRAHARLCAVALANRTQPFSENAQDKKGLELGQKKVKRDVNKVIKDRQDLDIKAELIQDESIKARARKLLSSGNLQAIGALFQKIGFAKGGFEVLSGKASIKNAHTSSRSKTSGRAYRPKTLFLTEDVEKYSNEVAKRVGMSKAGWAECARIIGKSNGLKGDGARGIPGWAKKKQARVNGAVKDATRNTSEPYVVLWNKIPWVSRICKKSEQDFAVRIASDKMVKSFEKALIEAAKSNTKMRKIADYLTSQAA